MLTRERVCDPSRAFIGLFAFSWHRAFLVELIPPLPQCLFGPRFALGNYAATEPTFSLINEESTLLLAELDEHASDN